ncbi:MAG TPA: hypothetical protein VL547_05360 [Dinghuibacter sp.]|jgi:hypothetical protein|uniref:hypothetical protein n=1 Tax=Dinghuibacter sp. TaxID=2024697 RepID=UPI002C33277E|nr:hypothetical protein [Dinghuibacter sp.]HTJ11426.1 hypothetical protein [Dinghuibacter sp.]
MNKTLLIACFLVLSGVAQAQTLKDFFANESMNVTYLGLDFSLARVINDPGANGENMVDKVFPSMNDLTVKEVKKFDVAGAFRHKTLDHDFTGVTAHNANISKDALISSNTADATRLKEADIKALVSNLDMGGKKGIGIVFIVEAMDKSDRKFVVWPTIVNMDTHTVLITERINGKTGNGFGERNFWASGLKDAFDDIDGYKYKEWKKAHS